MPAEIELTPALDELQAELIDQGLELTRAEYIESFGDRLVVFADRRISIRFVRDRGDWHIDIAVGRWPSDTDFLYLPTWAGTVGWDEEAAQGGTFGRSLPVGNFDGNKRDDLAIGSSGPGVDTGALHVVLGSMRGLRPKRSRYITEAKRALKGPGIGSKRRFSGELVAGDFDGNGRDDLAIGVPGADDQTGAVRVLRGSRHGLTLRKNRYLSPLKRGMNPGEPDSGNWGLALASGDLDADGRDDLAVGAPFGLFVGQCIGSAHVLFGSPRGITKRGNQALTQSTPGIRGDGEQRRCDLFGRALLIADLDGRGPEELVIGEPQSREDVGVGGVHVLYPNRRRSLQRRGYRYLTQDTPGVKSDGAELLDGFGWRLAQAAP